MDSKKKEINRLVIYSFYDKECFIDEYVLTFLQGIRKIASHVLIVSGNKLDTDAKARLSFGANELIEGTSCSSMQNYREGINHIGFEVIAKYDEVILCDNKLFGPIFPFEQLFSYMEQKQESNLWSITAHNTDSFLVFRREVVNSEIFHSFWKTKKINESFDCVQYFKENGEKFIVYTDGKSLETDSKEKKCPVIHREVFCSDYGTRFAHGTADCGRKVMKSLKEHSFYDSGLVWKYLLRTQNMADIKKNLQLNYVVSSRLRRRSNGPDLKIALIMHIYFSDLAEYCRKYAEAMPENTDVYVTVPDDEKLVEVKKAFQNFPYQIEFRITGNRGRDVAPFLVGCKDVIKKYDLICKMHDKRAYHVHPMSLGQSWSYKCFECLLKNKIAVENIISLFREQPYLGLMAPPVPNHGPYYPITGRGEWGDNYTVVKKLAHALGLHVDIDRNKEPVAPLGSMFWARTAALKPLFDYDWQYEEMPEEPLAPDATILHAIERIYPFCAQEAGYYSAWVMSDSYARIEMDNWEYLNRGLLKAETEKIGELPFHELLQRIDERRSSLHK